MPHEHHGDCLYCGTSNSYSSLVCRSCHTELPWAPALTQMLGQAPAPHSLAPAQGPGQLAITPTPLHGVMQPQGGARPKYCAHCGSSHSPTAHFCSECGTAILSAPQPSPSPTPFQWPLRSAAPTPAAMASMTPAQAQGGYLFSPQQMVNVNVVTEQKSEHKKRGRGWLSRFFGFFFAACATLAGLAFLSSAPGPFVVCVALALLAGLFAALAR